MCPGPRYCRGPDRKQEGLPTAGRPPPPPSPSLSPAAVYGNVRPSLSFPPTPDPRPSRPRDRNARHDHASPAACGPALDAAKRRLRELRLPAELLVPTGACPSSQPSEDENGMRLSPVKDFRERPIREWRQRDKG